jgi:dihydropteroate synthase
MLETLETDNLADAARERGEQLLERLRDEVGGHPFVKAVRGRGLLVGLELGPTRSSGILGRLLPGLVEGLSRRIFGQWLAVRLLEHGIVSQPASQQWNVLELQPPLTVTEDEIERVIGVVEPLARAGALVSVDTYKPAVAEAAVAAGAAMLNDVSGLADPALAEVCARSGAALVITHTRVAPKGTLLDPDAYDDVVADVVAFLRDRMALARSHGVALAQIVLDPGPDFAKTPAQTVAVLRRLDAVVALGRPVLLAVSRKDFLAAITGRAPRERGAGTLAALAAGVDAGARIVRVHDVAAAADFLAVRSVLRGERDLGRAEGLTAQRYPGGPPRHLALD